MPLEIIADPKFLGERGNRCITLKQVMVKNLETCIRDFEGRRLSSKASLLPYGDTMTRLRQSQSGSKAREAAADDSDLS